MALNCPRCGGLVQGPPEREWSFHHYRVSRFKCEHGDKFNLYSSGTKTFTIPRAGGPLGFCRECKTQNPSHAVFCKNCGSKL